MHSATVQCHYDPGGLRDQLTNYYNNPGLKFNMIVSPGLITGLGAWQDPGNLQSQLHMIYLFFFLRTTVSTLKFYPNFLNCLSQWLVLEDFYSSMPFVSYIRRGQCSSMRIISLLKQISAQQGIPEVLCISNGL